MAARIGRLAVGDGDTGHGSGLARRPRSASAPSDEGIEVMSDDPDQGASEDEHGR